MCANPAKPIIIIPSTIDQEYLQKLKDKVEPVWSYGDFEWLLFPAFPSHDIQMSSWSVPSFSPHSCTIHQDISSITGPRTAQLTLESLSKSRARKSGYAISWSRSSNPQYLQTFARLIWFEEGAPKLLVTKQFQGEAWRIDRKWPHDHETVLSLKIIHET